MVRYTKLLRGGGKLLGAHSLPIGKQVSPVTVCIQFELARNRLKSTQLGIISCPPAVNSFLHILL